MLDSRRSVANLWIDLQPMTEIKGGRYLLNPRLLEAHGYNGVIREQDTSST